MMGRKWSGGRVFVLFRTRRGHWMLGYYKALRLTCGYLVVGSDSN